MNIFVDGSLEEIKEFFNLAKNESKTINVNPSKEFIGEAIKQTIGQMTKLGENDEKKLEKAMETLNASKEK